MKEAQRKKEISGQQKLLEYYELGKAHSKIYKKTVLKNHSESTGSFLVMSPSQHEGVTEPW